MVPQHARARRRPARAVPRRAAGPPILDAGCGPGGNGAWLAEHGDVVGVDRSPDALRFVHERRPDVAPVLGDLTALPLASASVDAAIAITVLYAVDDDAAAAAELARVLAPGGVLVVVEPAFPSLRRAHDTTVHGRRRYRRPGLRALLTARRAVGDAHDLRVLLPRAPGRRARARRPPRGRLAATGRRRRHRASDVERRALDRGVRAARRRRAPGARTASTSPSAPRCWRWRCGAESPAGERAGDLLGGAAAGIAALAQHDHLPPELGEVEQGARHGVEPEELRLAEHPPVVVHPDLGEAGTAVLELAHQLDADHPGGVLEPHPVEGGPADQAEVAVGVADAEAERERHEPVVHTTHHPAHQVVGPPELVPLHDVDVVGRVLHEELELGGVELTVTVGVEDPLPGGGAEAGDQRAAVAAVLRVRDHTQQGLLARRASRAPRVTGRSSRRR